MDADIKKIKLKHKSPVLNVRKIVHSAAVLDLFLILWVLLGFNTKMADIIQYKTFYAYAQNGIRYPGVETGYYLFARVCSLFGMTYQEFLKTYAFCGVCLLVGSIEKYTDKKSTMCLLLLIFFPYLHIIAAQRNFMAFAIAVWGMRYIVSSNTMRNNVKYVAVILISSKFHTSALFYLIFLFTRFRYRIVVRLTLIITVITGSLLYLSNIFDAIFIPYIPKLDLYINRSAGTRIETKIFLLVYFSSKFYFCHMLNAHANEQGRSLLKISLMTIPVFPLATVNMNFMRTEYNMIVLLSAAVFGRNHYLGPYRFVKIAYLLFYAISGYILLYLFSFESVVKTIWLNNDFWRLLQGG